MNSVHAFMMIYAIIAFLLTLKVGPQWFAMAWICAVCMLGARLYDKE